ncbi:MAG: aldo/keto reductase [Clostridiales Family XIII bacterium]|jgi:aryl-alcohol dehydrogenase-like predicted oxidoreductase|nr:aldo/keto reductase [Clostridiales Family XIII bacterium]
MEYKNLGKTKLKVSQVGMGVLNIGWSQLNLPIKDGAKIIKYALKRGINFFDTAEYYRTYDYIREALKNGEYDPIIASKSLSSSYEGMKTAIEDCRKALNKDCIEIFLLHEVRQAPDYENRTGALSALKEAQRKGHIIHIGLSTHYSDVCEMAAENKDMEIIFPLINFKGLGIRRGNGPGRKEEMERAIKLAGKNGKGVFLMKAFGGGNLTPYYAEALNYARNLKGVDSIMLGFGKTEEIDNAVDFFEGKLPANFQPDTKEKRMHIDPGDCEGCGACIKICPNKAIYFNKSMTATIDSKLCITCGYCAPACPVRAIIMY